MTLAVRLMLAAALVGVAACGGAESVPSLDAPTAPVEWFVAPSGDDGNRGTSAVGAFRTIAQAVELAGPGDSVYVLPGEYPEQVVLESIGSRSAPLTIMGINGLPVLVASDGATVGIECHGCVNVHISCLDIRGFADSAVLVSGSTDVVVRDLVIAGPGRHGVEVVGSDGVVVEWLSISHLTDPGGAAVRIESSSGVVVADNRAHDVDGEAWVFSGSEVAAERNEVVARG